MFEEALKILELFEKKGYKAYIVGGYVRDSYLKIDSTDIDICVLASLNTIKKILKKCEVYEDFMAIKYKSKGYTFDITSLRKDVYIFGKLHVKLTNKLEKDVLRRDFTINALYMDKEKNIIDLLNSKRDIENKLIRSIGNSNKKLKQDPLRILRAIRYSTVLDFNIDRELINSIKSNKELLNNISWNRKKEELNKIFESKNFKKALTMFEEFEMKDYLGINYSKVNYTSNPLGIWAQIDFNSLYPFTKKEMKTIKNIRKLLLMKEINNYTVYKFGKEINIYCAEILRIPKKKVINIYNNLQIYDINDIKVSFIDVCKLLGISPSSKSIKIYKFLENKIVEGKLINKEKNIKEYILKYKGGFL